MNEVASDTPDASPPRPKRRWRFLLIAILVALLAIVAVWFLLPDRFDPGMRAILSFIIVVVAAVVIGVWFFTMAHMPRRARWITAFVLVLLAVATAVSVRRVEFSGDMVPTFDFRWTQDRYAVLEAHRAGQRKRETQTASHEKESRPAAEVPSEWDILEYRGPNHDGVMEGPALARDWSQRPPKLVWRQPVGGGYAAFVVAGPQLITIEQRRDKETVVAYDIDTGRERWIYDYTALFSEQLGGDGPRATPTIHNGRVYSLGATGILSCVELADGKAHWAHNILQQNGSANLDWAMAGSPLVYDDLVLVNPGNQKGTADSRAITTFDALSGDPHWGGGAAKAGYASPMLVTLAGVRQVLNFGGTALAGYDATDGRELWHAPWKSDFDINAAQPVVLPGDRVLITSASGTGLYQIKHADDAWAVDELWKNTRFKGGYCCPIAYNGYAYGIDGNMLACIELATGKRMWKARDGRYGHGQLLRRGDLLLVLGEAGELALVEAAPERFHELGRIQAIEGKTWNNPTLVGGRIYVRNHLEMAAYDLPLEE